jgi:catechol 2,3-dioxygenase
VSIRSRVAHVSAIELISSKPDETARFFVDLMALEVARVVDGSYYLHTWDDYEAFTVKVTPGPVSAPGRMWLRAASADDLALAVRDLEALGLGDGWDESEELLGPTYHFRDTDGHRFGIYWEARRWPGGAHPPALKNQASAFPGRGANVRRIDHVNFLAVDAALACLPFEQALGAHPTEQIRLDSGAVSARWLTFTNKTYDLVYTNDWTGTAGRLHHVAFATDTREDILRAADVFLDNGIHIETGPHKHAIQQTFFLYVYEPSGHRIELCNSGARLTLAPDSPVITWTQAERAKGQAWGLKTIESFHTHGTPVVAEATP